MLIIKQAKPGVSRAALSNPWCLLRTVLCLWGSLCALATFSAYAGDGVIPAKRSQEYPWMSVAQWEQQHREDVLIAEQTEPKVDVLFIGDSITAGWDAQVWQQYFAPLQAANFGIGGDHTGNLLWRLQHGAIGQLQPRLIVLLIGVNNFGHLHETPAQVAQGVSAVVQQIRLAWPRSRLLLNGILPYTPTPGAPERQQVAAANKLIQRLADGRAIVFKDYGPLFVTAKGEISADMMADFLHPTPKAYQQWAQVLAPDIQALLKFGGY